ncbi:hypothetical protein CKQ79_28795, partial [Klebsiella pneumoniae]
MKNDYFIKVCIWYKAYSPAENTVSILSGLYAENGLPVCIKFQAMTQMLIPLSNWQAIYHNIPAMNSPLTCRHFVEKRLFYKSLHLVQSIQSS